jgi:hypothetical protein
MDGCWFEINAQSPERPCGICAHGNSTLYVWYTLEFKCFGNGALTPFGTPRANIDMSRLSADYDSSIGPNVDILQDVRRHGI